MVFKPNGTSHQISKCRTKVVLDKKASPSWILAKNHSSDVLYTIRHSCQHQTERRTNSATLIKTERRTNYLNSIQRLASLANHSLATLAIKHLVSTIILTLSYALLRSPITRSIHSQSNT